MYYWNLGLHAIIATLWYVAKRRCFILKVKVMVTVVEVNNNVVEQ